MRPALDELEAALESAGTELSVRVRELPSGAVFVDVRRGERTTTLEGRPDGRWGVSPDVSSHELFLQGHPHVFTTYEEAAADLLEWVRSEDSE
jgi:hypothetical protein